MAIVSKVHISGEVRSLRKVAQLGGTEDYFIRCEFYAVCGFLRAVVSRRSHDLFSSFLAYCNALFYRYIGACGWPVVSAHLEAVSKSFVFAPLSGQSSADPVFRLSP